MPINPYINSCCFSVDDGGKKAVWELTYRCPLRCQHCCLGNKTDGEGLNLNKARQVVDKLKKIGVTQILLTGGEAVQLEYFFDLVHYTLAQGFWVSLSTCGYFDEETVRRLAELDLKNINIGIDSLDSAKHNFFRRVPDALEKALFTAMYLRDRGRPVAINITLSRLNVHDLNQMLQFCLTNNFKVRISRLLPIGNAVATGKYYLLNKAEEEKAAAVLEQYKEVIKISGARLSGAHFLPKCRAGKQVVGISPNGKMSPCVFLKNIDKRLEKDWTDQIPDWSQELNSAPWTMLKNGEKTCGQCGVRDDCQRGCLAAAISFNEGYDLLCGVEPTEKRRIEFVTLGFVFNPSRDKLLFLQHRKEPLVGWWLPPGGHIEPDQTPDAAVVEEVRKDTGLEVYFEDVYLASQGNWQADHLTRKNVVPYSMQREYIDYLHDHLDLIYVLRAFADSPLQTKGGQVAMWLDEELCQQFLMPENVRQTALKLLRSVKHK